MAALPIRRIPTGGIEVLLITSRDTQRWIIPKGWPWTDKTDPESAAGEAEEEAGITGDIEASSFGRYVYEKRLKADSVTLSVDVFLLWVQEVREDWLEKPERRRLWFPPDEAADAVQEPQLKAVLRALNSLPHRR